MHTLPTNNAHFQELLADVRKKRDEGYANGSLPTYPVFVDRLFKEMPMVSLDVVKKLITEIAAADPDGKLYVTGLINTLNTLDSPDGSAMHAAVGCAGEGGEMLDCVKKVFIYAKSWTAFDKKTGQTALENLLEEMGDFRFYYQKFLNMLNITDEDVQAHNYAKLNERYSTGVYTDAHALERKDKANAPQFIGDKSATLNVGRSFIRPSDVS